MNIQRRGSYFVFTERRAKGVGGKGEATVEKPTMRCKKFEGGAAPDGWTDFTSGLWLLESHAPITDRSVFSFVNAAGVDAKLPGQ